jgi:hypothetical protein
MQAKGVGGANTLFLSAQLTDKYGFKIKSE